MLMRIAKGLTMVEEKFSALQSSRVAAGQQSHYGGRRPAKTLLYRCGLHIFHEHLAMRIIR